MESLRQVALYLHALAPSDRRWMLRRLPAEHGPMLRALLRELNAMGIPRDPGLLEFGEADEAKQVSPVRESAGERMGRARATQISALLTGEPREVVAAVMKTGDWKWQQDLLKSYGPAERNWLSEHAASKKKALPPAVREVLITLVERRLERDFADARDGAMQYAESGSWWNRLSRGAPWRR